MCGIAIVLNPRRDIAEEACRKALDALQHRGPDGQGLATFETLAGSLVFGHRRLAIIDLSPSGAQPMTDSVSQCSLTFNGEIYNYRTLKKELLDLGCTFRGTSDTEVILQGVQAWGNRFFERARGMFALGFWSPQDQTLTLSRDHVGMKPLYFYQDAKTLIVASEIRAVLATGLVPFEIDRSSIATLLSYGSVVEPRTIVRGISMVPPRSIWTIDFKKRVQGDELPIQKSAYWQLPTSIDQSICFDFSGGLNKAVREHLESDVPVGVFLSGGVDSTAVAEIAAKHCDRLFTFTVGFPEYGSIDESTIAHETSKSIGSQHIQVNFADKDVMALAGRWIDSLDQPSLDGFNTYLVTKAAREAGLKVALSGLGGDELFGGYATYRMIPQFRKYLAAAQIVPTYLRGWLAKVLLGSRSKSEQAKASQLCKAKAKITDLLLWKRRLFCDMEMAAFGYHPKTMDLNSLFLPLERSIPELAHCSDYPAAIAGLESDFYMRDTLLRDSDISGMAHGFELRMPLLDRDVMESALKLSQQQRMSSQGINKPILVQSAGPRTLEVSGLTKRGFTLPYHQWLSEPLRECFESGIDSLDRFHVMDKKCIESYKILFWEQKQTDSWARIWLLSTLGTWLEKHANPRSV